MRIPPLLWFGLIYFLGKQTKMPCWSIICLVHTSITRFLQSTKIKTYNVIILFWWPIFQESQAQSVNKESMEGKQIEDHDNIRFEERDYVKTFRVWLWMWYFSVWFDISIFSLNVCFLFLLEFELVICGSVLGIFQFSVLY